METSSPSSRQSQLPSVDRSATRRVDGDALETVDAAPVIRAALPRAAAVAFFAVLAACTKPAETPATRVDVPAPPPAPAVVATGAIPRSAMGRECEATVRLVELKKSTPTCVLTEHVSGDAGKLTWPCKGDGVASIQFAAVRFEGEVRGGLLDVRLSSSFPFRDGCQWQSEQTITGEIASGALQYGYSELPSKDSKGCWSACQGSAAIDLQPQRPPSRGL